MGEITDSENLRFRRRHSSDDKDYINIQRYEWENKESDTHYKKVRIGGIRSHDRLTEVEQEIPKHEFKKLKEELRESDKWEER